MAANEKTQAKTEQAKGKIKEAMRPHRRQRATHRRRTHRPDQGRRPYGQGEGEGRLQALTPPHRVASPDPRCAYGPASRAGPYARWSRMREPNPLMSLARPLPLRDAEHREPHAYSPVGKTGRTDHGAPCRLSARRVPRCDQGRRPGRRPDRRADRLPGRADGGIRAPGHRPRPWDMAAEQCGQCQRGARAPTHGGPHQPVAHRVGQLPARRQHRHRHRHHGGVLHLPPRRTPLRLGAAARDRRRSGAAGPTAHR